jgi:hypothetical protein
LLVLIYNAKKKKEKEKKLGQCQVRKAYKLLFYDLFQVYKFVLRE